MENERNHLKILLERKNKICSKNFPSNWSDNNLTNYHPIISTIEIFWNGNYMLNENELNAYFHKNILIKKKKILNKQSIKK